MVVIDLVGQRFGKFLVLHQVKKPTTVTKSSFWLCVCDCGMRKVVNGASLRHGRSTSCGCKASARAASLFTKHGGYKLPEYYVWRNMHQRCKNRKVPSFKNYGGRGICVTVRWEKFENFLADMGSRPSPKHMLERQDNEKGYGPDNCVWATRKEQSRNTRRTVFLTWRGRRLSLAGWADELGVAWNTLWSRYRSGWSVDRILGTPIRSFK